MAAPRAAGNRGFQAILPIRGKILNVERARIDRMLANNEVLAVLTALGTGIHEDFDLDRCARKIVLIGDADVDRQRITTLLLTLLFRYMKPLVEAGQVPFAQPPLYRIQLDQRSAPRASPTPNVTRRPTCRRD